MLAATRQELLSSGAMEEGNSLIMMLAVAALVLQGLFSITRYLYKRKRE
jgi:hypothetical protein